MPSDLELARIVEGAEVRVWSDMVQAASPDVVRRLGLATVPFAGGIALVASNVPSGLYNRAFGFGIDAPVDEESLDRVIALYRRDAGFAIQPSPFAQPARISDWLESRALRRRFHWVRWVRDDRPPDPAPTDLRIETVPAERAAAFVDLALTIFTDPRILTSWLVSTVGAEGWTYYWALDGDQPVGIAALYVREGVGWLGWGGTLASHRGRGSQSALIARRLQDGIERGCRWFTVETAEDPPERPNPSFRNVARAGFRLLFLRPSHEHRPPAPPGGSSDPSNG